MVALALAPCWAFGDRDSSQKRERERPMNENVGSKTSDADGNSAADNDADGLPCLQAEETEQRQQHDKPFGVNQTIHAMSEGDSKIAIGNPLSRNE